MTRYFYTAVDVKELKEKKQKTTQNNSTEKYPVCVLALLPIHKQKLPDRLNAAFCPLDLRVMCQQARRASREPSGALQNCFCPRQFSTGPSWECLALCELCGVETSVGFSRYRQRLGLEIRSTQAGSESPAQLY